MAGAGRASAVLVAELDTVALALDAYLDVPGLLQVCYVGNWAGKTFATDQAGIEAAVGYVELLDGQGADGI